VGHLPNVRYLSGFTGSNARLLVEPDRMILFTDPRYTIQAGAECQCLVKTVKGPLEVAVGAAAKQRRIRRLGFEANRISWMAHEALREQTGKPIALKPAAGLVEQWRMVKHPEEIARIREAVQVAARAFERTIRRIRPSHTKEKELAGILELEMKRLGADGPSFDTIVASGTHTALPHAQPRPAVIQTDQLLLIDMGASVSGYASDMTRTLAVGRIHPEGKRMYRAVLEAQLAAIAAARPGVTAAHVDRAARAVLKGHGLGKEFVHSTGHGLGLEIHESPRLGAREKVRLEEGMAITIEPGVYRQGFCGVRIEDTVLVTRTGAEVLTPVSKELLTIE
jgi:Xaa-Pro aminopeptidase